MRVPEEEIHHVADLPELSFSEEETAEFATTLPKIIDMVELLNEVDTEGVPATTIVTDRKTVMHGDTVVADDNHDEPFENAPQSESYYIKVPAILEDKGDA